MRKALDCQERTYHLVDLHDDACGGLIDAECLDVAGCGGAYGHGGARVGQNVDFPRQDPLLGCLLRLEERREIAPDECHRARSYFDSNLGKKYCR